MKNLGSSVLLFVFLCSGMARAAEFLVLDIGADSNIPVIVMTDSSSITAGETGRKLATLLSVHDAGEWDERKMEVDCTTQRWRELGGVRHGVGDNVFAEAPDDNWTDLQSGSAELRVRDAVCAWPDKRPSADKIVTGVLHDILDQASAAASKMVEEKQRERDDDK